jgi:TPR repeat protein
MTLDVRLAWLLCAALGLAPALAFSQRPLDTPASMNETLFFPVGASPAVGPQDPVVRQALEQLKDRAMNTSLRPSARGEAAWLLGLIELHGAGIGIDTAQAQQWFELAQSMNHAWAAAGLAWCEIDGCQRLPDPARARRWLPLLQTVDRPRAQYLAWLIESRLAPPEAARPATGAGPSQVAEAAQRLLTQAAQDGDVHALIELGLQQVARQNLNEALTRFETAAPRSAVAATNAALVRERMQSLQEASSALPMSAASLFVAAQRSHRGEGQPANYTEAIRLYQLARNKGSIDAQKMLALIYSRPDANGQLDIGWMQQLAYLDLSGDSPRAASSAARPGLQREPTPLIDQLPLAWRERTSPLPP